MNLRVLIVEDEPELVGILAFLLKEEGYDVGIAFDGKKALSEIRSNPPDMVLLDIMLPQMDGFELCKIVRRDTSIPVVILSAKGCDEHVIKGLELGADDYITKPFNHRELILRVNRLLARVEQNKRTNEIAIGNVRVFPVSKEVFVGSRKINVTPI